MSTTRPWAALLAWLAVGPALAAEPHPPAAPPANLAFNFPGPPVEGARDYFRVAEGGQARCVIVSPAGAGPATQRAAAGLAKYLELVTGAKFAVITDAAAVPAGQGAIHVGDTSVARKVPLDLPELRYGTHAYPNVNGYLVDTVDPRTLVIRGGSDTAVSHGVVGFLRRYAGVREFWQGDPGGVGDVIPHRPTLTVPRVEWRDWPYMFSRTLSMARLSGLGTPALDFFRRQNTLPSSENYATWLPPAEYASAHPEYFPLINGRRLIPKTSKAVGWQPCVSNPDVVRIMAENVLKFFRGHPDDVGINFAINDGGRDCMCDRCRAMDAPNTDYSSQKGMTDRYVKFTNQVADIVAREFPRKKLVFLAYGAARSAPLTVTLRPNVIPVITTGASAFRAWDEWSKTNAPEMGLYLHHDDDFLFVLPPFDPHQSARKLHYAVASGRERSYYMEAHPLWPLSGPGPWVTSELLWDPRRDVDALLDEYHATFFGPAAAPMRSFNQALEAGYERWRQQEGEDHPQGRDVALNTYARSARQFKLLTDEETTRMSADLAQAATLARGDARVAERVQLTQWMFGLVKLGVEEYWIGQRLREKRVASEADAREVIADARKAVAVAAATRQYVLETLERPPAARYSLFQRPGGRENPLYVEMKSGKPSDDAAQAIGSALDRAADSLRGSLGPQRAEQWWRTLRAGEKDPLLAGAFESAGTRAVGQELPNLARDPGFEDLAAKLGRAGTADLTLDDTAGKKAGVHQWFPERSTAASALTAAEKHSGLVSLRVAQSFRARVARSVPAEEGERYRVGFWFKQGPGEGKYTLSVDSAGTGKRQVLVSIPVSGPPGEWQEVKADVTMPAGARNVSVQLLIDRQAEDARCWVDDFFIERYPASSTVGLLGGPSELVSRSSMRGLVDDLRTFYRWVVVDNLGWAR